MIENLPTNNQFSRFRKYYRNLEPIISQPKNRMYTTVIFTFLAISLLAWYAIRPTIKTILYLRKEIADKTELNKQLETKITDLIQAQSTYQSIQEQLPLLSDATPENPDSLDAVIQIRNLINTSSATSSAISISSVPLLSTEAIKAKKIIANNNLIEFTLDTTINGTYHDIEDILNKIVTMRRIFVIDSLQLNPTNDDIHLKNATSSSKIVKMGLHLKSYYKPIKK